MFETVVELLAVAEALVRDQHVHRIQAEWITHALGIGQQVAQVGAGKKSNTLGHPGLENGETVVGLQRVRESVVAQRPQRCPVWRSRGACPHEVPGQACLELGLQVQAPGGDRRQRSRQRLQQHRLGSGEDRLERELADDRYEQVEVLRGLVGLQQRERTLKGCPAHGMGRRRRDYVVQHVPSHRQLGVVLRQRVETRQ